MNVKSAVYCLLGGLVLCTSSCTISDSDEPTVKSGRLQSINVMSVPFYAITYDASGRVIQLSDAISQTKTTIDYSAKRLQWEEFDERYDRDGNLISYRSYKTIWNNFELNSNGCIVSAYATEIEYDYNGEENQRFEYPVTFDYDGNGRITRFTIVDPVDRDEITLYQWRDGLLNEVVYEDEGIKFDYTDAPQNFNRQWVPWWGDPSSLAITGLMGEAPVKLISKSIINEGFGYSETSFFYYNLTDTGYISGLRMIDSYGDNLTFSFSYTNTRNEDLPFSFERHQGKRSFSMFHKRNK